MRCGSGLEAVEQVSREACHNCGEVADVVTCTVCMADECSACHALTWPDGSEYVPSDEAIGDYARALNWGFTGSFGQWLHEVED